MGEEFQAEEMACIQVQVGTGSADSKESSGPAVTGQECARGERWEMNTMRKVEVSAM